MAAERRALEEVMALPGRWVEAPASIRIRRALEDNKAVLSWLRDASSRPTPKATPKATPRHTTPRPQASPAAPAPPPVVLSLQLVRAGASPGRRRKRARAGHAGRDHGGVEAEGKQGKVRSAATMTR